VLDVILWEAEEAAESIKICGDKSEAYTFNKANPHSFAVVRYVDAKGAANAERNAAKKLKSNADKKIKGILDLAKFEYLNPAWLALSMRRTHARANNATKSHFLVRGPSFRG
jgi:hypothetical protein